MSCSCLHSSSAALLGGRDIGQCWTLDKGATNRGARTAPSRQGGCPADRLSCAGRAGSPRTEGSVSLTLRLRQNFLSDPGEFGESSLPFLVLTSDKKGSQQEGLSCFFWVRLLPESEQQTDMCTGVSHEVAIDSTLALRVDARSPELSVQERCGRDGCGFRSPNLAFHAQLCRHLPALCDLGHIT